MWTAAAVAATARVLAELDARNTVVHLHGFTQGLSSSPVRCALQRGFRVVCTLHDYFTVCPNGGFFDYATAAPCERRPLSWACVTANCDKRMYAHKLYRVVRTGMQRAVGKIPGGITHYIAPSVRAADVLRPYLPENSQVFSLSNPVEVPFAPPVGVAENGAVLAIGRVEPEKGISVLIEAARLAKVRVVLVGDGALRGLAEASGICAVTGWLPRQGVLAQLESARCLVFPSLCYETFGLSVAEAAARGVPVIVSDVTGAAERVKDNVTGWHVPAGDVSALTLRLRSLQDDTMVSAAGQAAYEAYWLRPSTLSQHAEELLQIYESILGSVDSRWR